MPFLKKQLQDYVHGLLVCGLFCGSCATFASLPPPVFSFTSPVGGNCTGTTAVDSDGRLWTESGCEARTSGVRYRGRLTPARRKRFDEAISVLRRLPDVRAARGCRETMAKFAIRESDGTEREWIVCVPEYNERWPSPFAEIFAAME